MSFNKELLKAELKAKGYRMADLEDWLNVSRSTIAFKSNGTIRWAREDIVEIARHIGRDKILDIFFADEFANQQNEGIENA